MNTQPSGGQSGSWPQMHPPRSKSIIYALIPKIKGGIGRLRVSSLSGPDPRRRRSRRIAARSASSPGNWGRRQTRRRGPCRGSGKGPAVFPPCSSSVCGPAKPADQQVACGKVHQVSAVGRLERGENQVGVDQRENLGRRAERDEMVVIHRCAQERARDRVGRLLGLLALGLRLGRGGRLFSLFGRFLFVRASGSVLTTFFTGLLASRPTDFSVAQAAAPPTRMSVPPLRTQSLSRATNGSPAGPDSGRREKSTRCTWRDRGQRPRAGHARHAGTARPDRRGTRCARRTATRAGQPASQPWAA